MKKVAEAKARKKRKAMKAWETLKKHASSITHNTELTERSKSKAIQKLYNKVRKKEQRKVLKVIQTKGGTRTQRKSNLKVTMSCFLPFLSYQTAYLTPFYF